jgi:thioredoxin-dependent peroxiredoxin
VYSSLEHVWIWRKPLRLKFLVFCLTLIGGVTMADALEVGSPAPLFETKTHEDKPFSLAGRKGHWTVLYFYPKASTPGCTKQACAFRDNLKALRDLDAEVYGISSDDVAGIKKFHAEQHLNFTLLADPDQKIITAYGTKMPLVSMSKRWTFILDPDLKIVALDKNVDPIKDASGAIKKIQELKESRPKETNKSN